MNRFLYAFVFVVAIVMAVAFISGPRHLEDSEYIEISKDHLIKTVPSTGLSAGESIKEMEAIVERADGFVYVSLNQDFEGPTLGGGFIVKLSPDGMVVDSGFGY